MRLATLFSGIGAPEQAAKRVFNNLELVFACEKDKFARQSFKANYNLEDEHFHEEIYNLDGTQYKGKVDILVGGSPCQSFSIAGLRKGINDKRGELIYEYIRVVNEVKPPVIIYENVKGIMSIDKGRTIKEFAQALRDIGYHVHYEVVNSKDYGVPQNRERLFLVGFLNANNYHAFQFAPKQKLTKCLRDVLESNVDEKYYLSDKMIDFFIKHTKKNKEKGNGFKFNPTIGDNVAKTLTNSALNRIDDNYIQEGVIGMLDIKGNEQIRRVYGVNGVAPTLSTMQGGNQEPKILTAQRIRKLTPRECLRLQDFPDTFKQVVSDSQMYKQAGNSMTVAVLEMIFRQIIKAQNEMH